MKDPEKKRSRPKKVKSLEFEDVTLTSEKSARCELLHGTRKHKDDLAIIEQQRLNRADDFRKYLKNGLRLAKQEDQKKSQFRKFFSSAVGKVTSSVNKLLDTKLGRILMSKVIGGALTISFTVLAIVLPPTSPVVLPMAIISLVAWASGRAADFFKIRRVRKLSQENDLLVQNRDDISKQQYLLALDPKLAKAVEGKLLETTNKADTPTNRYHINYKTGTVKAIGDALINTTEVVPILVSDITAAASGNPLAIAKVVKSGMATIARVAFSTTEAAKSANFVDTLRIYINYEASRPDVPHYKNLQELSKLALDQHIQTTTLTELLRDENYFNWTKEEISQRFALYKRAVTEVLTHEHYSKLTPEQQHEKIHQLHNELEGLNNHKHDSKITELKKNNKLMEIAKDLGRVFNPFYTSPTEVKQHIPLTKSLDSIGSPQVKSSRHLTKAVSIQEVTHEELTIKVPVQAVSYRDLNKESMNNSNRRRRIIGL